MYVYVCVSRNHRTIVLCKNKLNKRSNSFSSICLYSTCDINKDEINKTTDDWDAKLFTYSRLFTLIYNNWKENG